MYAKPSVRSHSKFALSAISALALFSSCTKTQESLPFAPSTAAYVSFIQEEAKGIAVPHPEDIPTIGRSTFDELFTSESTSGKRTWDIPHPFEKVLERLTTHVQASETEPKPLLNFLIPLGRSLQRNAGFPEPFKYPRVVVGTDAVGRAHLKDKIYLGFHEKAASIEVISYNEAQGRFEFQIVKNYREGAEPSVFYASRTTCISCHQNEAPIFSKGPWEETNFNVGIATKIREARPLELQEDTAKLYGVLVDAPLQPFRLDSATDRSTSMLHFQSMWKELADKDCLGRNCQREIISTVLRLGLSGQLSQDLNGVGAIRDELKSHWSQKWPQGLAFINADLLNRDPLELNPKKEGNVQLPIEIGNVSKDELERLLRESAISPHLEPLNTRPVDPHETLTFHDEKFTTRLEMFLRGLRDFFSAEDFQVLDQALQNHAKTAPSKTVSANCKSTTKPGGSFKVDCESDTLSIERLMFKAGETKVSGNALILNARIETGEFSGTAQQTESSTHREVKLIDIRTPTLSSLRTTDGNRITEIACQWAKKENGEIDLAQTKCSVTQLQDFDAWLAAFQNLDSFLDKPFSRRAILTSVFRSMNHEIAPLLASQMRLMDVDPAKFPAIEVDQTTDLVQLLGGAPNQTLQIFTRRCSACHINDSNSPSAFLLHPEGPEAGVALCAERILYRLLMWDLHREGQETPQNVMPPRNRIGSDENAHKLWDQERTALKTLTFEMIRKKTPEITLEDAEIREKLLNLEFSKLPHCVSN